MPEGAQGACERMGAVLHLLQEQARTGIQDLQGVQDKDIRVQLPEKIKEDERWNRQLRQFRK